METLPLNSPQAFSAEQLVRHAAPNVAGDFAGLGVVFYDSLAALPHLQLDVVGEAEIDHDLPHLLEECLQGNHPHGSLWCPRGS